MHILSYSHVVGRMIHLLRCILLCLLIERFGECCRFGDGPNCAFPCRCKSRTCNPEDGACDDQGCANGPVVPYEGQGCRVENMSYMKNTTQIGSYNGQVSSNAVDGILNPDNQHNQCSLPLSNKQGAKAWWRVDLDDIYNITRIDIYTGNPNFHKPTDFKILVGDDERLSRMNFCATYDVRKSEIIAPDVITLNCSHPMIGRYLAIQAGKKGEHSDYMYFCEVVVMAFKTIECSDKCTGGCNVYTGCDKCESGWMLPNCHKECPANYWGVNCMQECGNCKSETACNPVNGSCLQGCSDLYMGDDCRTDKSRFEESLRQRVTYPCDEKQTESSVETDSKVGLPEIDDAYFIGFVVGGICLIMILGALMICLCKRCAECRQRTEYYYYVYKHQYVNTANRRSVDCGDSIRSNISTGSGGEVIYAEIS